MYQAIQCPNSDCIMNSHHCKHLKCDTKEYEEQLKPGWKSHIGKIELQKGSMFFTDTAFHITYFFTHWWTQCFIFASQTNWGNKRHYQYKYTF